MSPFKVVIPARFGSTRLPGKPLADIGGLPMVVHVAQRAGESRADEVIVATDDPRVVDAVQEHGQRACMTRLEHPSGSDRVMEVATMLDWTDETIVVNVQGDEPLIPAAVIDQVAGLLDVHPTSAIATLCEAITDPNEVFDPNVVKVVRGVDHRALYFSRAAIPWDRAGFGTDTPTASLSPDSSWWRHIGIYAYRVGGLRRFCSLEPGRLERCEALEQLRALENDLEIAVAEAVSRVPAGVDTETDLERARRTLDH